MVVARVILKKAKSYRYGGRRWLQDVPQTINSKNDDVESYMTNGYFVVKVLKDTTSEKAVAKKSSKAVEDAPAPKKKVSKKTGTGLKKRS